MYIQSYRYYFTRQIENWDIVFGKTGDFYRRVHLSNVSRFPLEKCKFLQPTATDDVVAVRAAGGKTSPAIERNYLYAVFK